MRDVEYVSGPWAFCPLPTSVQIVMKEGGKVLAKIPLSAGWEIVSLMGHAPELMAAAKFVRESIGHDGGCLESLRPVANCAACVLDAAIAKAEGK